LVEIAIIYNSGEKLSQRKSTIKCLKIANTKKLRVVSFYKRGIKLVPISCKERVRSL